MRKNQSAPDYSLDAVDSMLSEIKDYEAEMASYYDYY